MVIPEPQYYTPLHSYIHTKKFCMDDAAQIQVHSKLNDENTKIFLKEEGLKTSNLTFTGADGELIYPEDYTPYSAQIRYSMELALKPIVTEFIRHQVRSLYFIYDSKQLKFAIMNHVENSFKGTTPDLYDSLVGRLVGHQFEVKDHRIEENFEELHQRFGPFRIHCNVTDFIIRAWIRFNKEYKINSNIYGVNFSTSIHDLIAFSNDFMTDVNQSMKIL